MATRPSPDVEFKHPPPRKNVLLLSCMDVRLLDNTVAFMDALNLQNRYDQLVFAGSALGVLRGSSPVLNDATGETRSHWKDAFFEQFRIAIEELGREIQDVYILEHRDCGAYRLLYPEYPNEYRDDESGWNCEERHHHEQASELAKMIRAFARTRQAILERATQHDADEVQRRKAARGAELWSKIEVRSFLMDLVGNVKHLPDAVLANSDQDEQAPAESKPARKATKKRG